MFLKKFEKYFMIEIIDKIDEFLDKIYDAIVIFLSKLNRRK